MPARSGEQTAANAARRAQIIAATIETVAELGYERTTFARIAERGGLSSTRLISYHFAGKDELVRAVVNDVYASINRFLVDRARIEPATRPIGEPADRSGGSPSDELRAYITGVVAFVDAHRTRMRALRSIYAALHDDEANDASYNVATDRGVLDHIQDILRRGQASGEFREFDTLVVASMIQRTLDGLPLLPRLEPTIDLQAYGSELVDMVQRATSSRYA